MLALTPLHCSHKIMSIHAVLRALPSLKAVILLPTARLLPTAATELRVRTPASQKFTQVLSLLDWQSLQRYLAG